MTVFRMTDANANLSAAQAAEILLSVIRASAVKAVRLLNVRLAPVAGLS
jgi:hypothetical protein